MTFPAQSPGRLHCLSPPLVELSLPFSAFPWPFHFLSLPFHFLSPPSVERSPPHCRWALLSGGRALPRGPVRGGGRRGLEAQPPGCRAVVPSRACSLVLPLRSLACSLVLPPHVPWLFHCPLTAARNYTAVHLSFHGRFIPLPFPWPSKHPAKGSECPCTAARNNTARSLTARRATCPMLRFTVRQCLCPVCSLCSWL